MSVTSFALYALLIGPVAVVEAPDTAAADTPTGDAALASAPLADDVPADEASSVAASTGPVPDADVSASASLRRRVDARLGPIRVAGDHLTLGGYVHTAFDATKNTESNPNDFEGFALRASRLMAATAFDLTDNVGVGMKVELDFQQGGVTATDAYATLNFLDDRLSLRVGQFKTAYSLSQLTGDTERQFARPRAGAPTADRLDGYRDRGFRLDVNVDAGPVHITSFTSVSNGDGANVNRNVDSRFLYATFLDVAPLGKVSLDEADLANSPFGFGLGGSLWYTPEVAATEFGIAGRGESETRFAVHARLKYRGLSLRGEYLAAHGEKALGGDQILRRGWYAQAGYVLPWVRWPQLEVVARVQQVDLNDTLTGFEATNPDFEVAKTRRIEAGLNLYLVDHRIKLQVLYRHTEILEGPLLAPTGDRYFGDDVTVGLQVGAF